MKLSKQLIRQRHVSVVVAAVAFAALLFLPHANAQTIKSVDKTLPEVLRSSNEKSCFCKLGGEVDDCSCTVESVDLFNNNQIYEQLTDLLATDYFKYYPVDLLTPCTIWKDEGTCSLSNCGVKACTEDEVPEGLKNGKGEENQSAKTAGKKYSEEAQEEGCRQVDETEVTLSKIDKTISEASNEAFKTWSKHDDAQNDFCQLDDETSPTLEYVNLLLNPERYTGYAGPHANKIWTSIYKENCFIDKSPDDSSYGLPIAGMCLEKRVFYRMVSGLHTSINTHLSARYYHPPKTAFDKGTWDLNASEFYDRFDPEKTYGHGPTYLRNLYFTYLVELRALAKAAPYLKDQLFYTGKKEYDEKTRETVAKLLDVATNFPHHFDESKLFQGEASQLKEEFRLKFLNISQIMNCVGCDKCRLWGKIQVRGMGTALKILFSGDDMSANSVLTSESSHFQLNRVEIVSLFNAFGRLSTSIALIEEFRRLVP
ncbi:ERO1-like protein alpha [Watersipora subatra]|uniref:ERO1-like protein alpha n=1 Tax=Watersipora subatra TaxID=2589382 RepID=UPI00355B3D98